MLQNVDADILRTQSDSRTALIADLKLVFRFAGFWNLASVTIFPYLLKSYFHYCFFWRLPPHIKKWKCSTRRPVLRNPVTSPKLF